MFNPGDFLNLAKVLATAAGEAEFRTSISRSYYACFLYARERLASLRRFQPTGTPEDHQELMRVLRGLPRPAPTVANQLLQLRQRRNNADYDLNPPINATDAQKVLQTANRAYNNISSIS